VGEGLKKRGGGKIAHLQGIHKEIKPHRIEEFKGVWGGRSVQAVPLRGTSTRDNRKQIGGEESLGRISNYSKEE